MMSTRTTILLLLFSVVVRCCNGEDYEYVEDDDYALEYVRSWSWAIFAIFMWLVPQISIIVGDYRENLFNSKKWNIPSSKNRKRKTKEEEETIYKKPTTTTITTDTITSKTLKDGQKNEEEEVHVVVNQQNDPQDEEEGPKIPYDKGAVAMMDDDNETGDNNNQEKEKNNDDNGNNNDSSSEQEQEKPLSFMNTISARATKIVLAQDDEEEEERRVICPKLQQGLMVVRQAALFTIGLWFMLMIAAAIGLSLGTKALDDRMLLVLEGLSRVFGAVVMSAVSFTIPSWAGLYFTQHHVNSLTSPSSSSSSSNRRSHRGTGGKLGKGSLKELRFNVRWAIHRPFCTSFFLMLPFCQGVTNVEIPLSILSGITTGFIIDASVYFTRRFKSRFRRNLFIGLFATFWGAASAYVMSDGVWFISEVWLENNIDLQVIVSLVVFIVWFMVLFLTHMAKLSYSRYQKQYIISKLGIDESHIYMNESTTANPTSPSRPRMATSLIMGHIKGGITSNAQDLKGERGWDSRRRTDDEEDDEEDDEWNVTQRRPPTGRDLETDLSNIQESNDDDDDDDNDEESSDKEYDEDSFDRKEQQEGKQVTTVESDLLLQDSSTKSNNTTVIEDEPTYRELFFQNYTCCGCVRGETAQQKSCLEKMTSILSWTLWWIGILGSLFLVVVNLGATYQQEAARAKLPYVASVLYDNMNDGPVCAFDDNGPESNITTFPNKDAAHAEGFLVVHCGACAACSDWHNLRLEYTTRDYLAKESARCARKSLFGGGSKAVTSCLEKPPIGFQGQCAICWTEDIMCTKSFCAMIFLQSLMINTVGNFQVGPDTITSASCEEAHCEAGNPGDFVYCSGATRRRMNVTSSITRPGAQLCGIVDVVWDEVFPE